MSSLTIKQENLRLKSIFKIQIQIQIYVILETITVKNVS